MPVLNDQHIANTLQAYVDAITGDDVEKVLELFAHNAVVEDPIGTDPHVGTQALRVFYQMAVDNVELMTLEGHVRVRDQWGAVGMTAKPKGMKMVMETLDVMEFNQDGLIINMKAYWGDSNFVES
ncbi:MAG: steroid delta-isomerase [Halioglobus sp.]|jgi:steroid delta-isomerase